MAGVIHLPPLVVMDPKNRRRVRKGLIIEQWNLGWGGGAANLTRPKLITVRQYIMGDRQQRKSKNPASVRTPHRYGGKKSQNCVKIGSVHRTLKLPSRLRENLKAWGKNFFVPK